LNKITTFEASKANIQTLWMKFVDCRGQ